jgi:hypothetical protein
MSEPRTPNPLVEQFRKGTVPLELRLMAAQGALPLKPVDFFDLLLLLLSDRDEQVVQAAQATLRNAPSNDLLPLVNDRQSPVEVLGWVLVHRPESGLREAVLQNPSTSDETIVDVAPSLPTDLAELVVINQARLLRSTRLLEAIESNERLNNDQRRRLRELRESFHIGETAPAPTPVVAPAAPPSTPPLPQPEAAPAEPEPEPEEVVQSEDEAVSRYLTEEERGEQGKVTAVQKLWRLNTAQKVMAALRGSREERAVLIRDPNRIVATAVLGSPRLTDAEVDIISGMRNVNDEILRAVGTHKEWVKRYAVVLNLVKNPRAPLGISLGLVPRLNPRDMRNLAFDRNVPEVIRQQALRFVRQNAGDKK